MRTACCSCGQLQVTTTGEPVRISVCHCLACQRRTGSAFGVQARFPRDAVTMTGRGSRYVRTADSGKTAHLHVLSRVRFHRVLRTGTRAGIHRHSGWRFADPGFPAPEISIYEAQQHGWVILAPGIDHERDVD